MVGDIGHGLMDNLENMKSDIKLLTEKVLESEPEDSWDKQ